MIRGATSHLARLSNATSAVKSSWRKQCVQLLSTKSQIKYLEESTFPLENGLEQNSLYGKSLQVPYTTVENYIWDSFSQWTNKTAVVSVEDCGGVMCKPGATCFSCCTLDPRAFKAVKFNLMIVFIATEQRAQSSLVLPFCFAQFGRHKSVVFILTHFFCSRFFKQISVISAGKVWSWHRWLVICTTIICDDKGK